MIFDSHAHYDDKAYDNDRHEIIMKARDEGVGLIMNIGSMVETSRRAVEIAKEYDFIYASTGVHPHYAEKLTDKDIDALASLASNPENSKKVKAIGEIGLDYHYDNSPRELQRKWFIRQLDMAKQLKLPVIIHSRDSAKDTLDILKNENAAVNGGVMHCFSGSRETMEAVVKMGFHVAFGGVVTFKKAVNVVEAVKHIPDSSLLIETDCPYLAPVPFRGERNYSGHLKYVVEKIADIRGTTAEHIEEITWNNAKQLFNIGPVQQQFI